MTKDDAATRAALNRLAREQLKERLLLDIQMDLQICRLEGWDHKAYIAELIDLLRGCLA